jgi:hypothetical protein
MSGVILDSKMVWGYDFYHFAAAHLDLPISPCEKV